jgi:hypothetical protein
MAKMYGAATMVGKDEMNGRINPALEPDDDLPVAEAQRLMQYNSGGAGGSNMQNTGVAPLPGQSQTAF